MNISSGSSTHAVVGDVRDGAAGGDRRHPRAIAARSRRRCTSSRWTSAPRRPRRVVKPLGEHRRRPRRSRPRARSRYGQARRTSANRSSSRHSSHGGLGDDLLRQHVERRVVRRRCDRARRRAPRAAAPRTRPGRRASSGTAGPSACRAIVCPARPTRCRNVAMRCGEPIWQTRSTWPMSMPSSSDAVATSALQLAALQPLLGVEARAPSTGCRGARRPRPSPSRSARWRATRSAILRVLTNTSVVRCARDQRGEPVVDTPPRPRATSPLRAASRGSSSARSMSRRWPSSTIDAVGAPSARRRRADQEARDLLDRLLRRRQADALQRLLATCVAAAPATAPGARRAASPITAWISSTITVRTCRSMSRLRSAVSSR